MSLVRVALSALGGVVLAASSAMAADYVAAVPPPPVWGFYFGGGVCYDWANFDIEKTKTFDEKKYKKIKEPKQVKKEKRVKKEKWVYNKHKKKYEKEYYYETVTWYETILIEKIVHYFETVTETKNYNGKAEAPCLTATVGYDYQIDQLFVVGMFFSYDWQKKEGDIHKVGYNYDAGDVWLGDIATVAGRAGVLVQPDLLVYALIGWSWTNGGFDLDPGPKASGNLNGPTIGAGVEKLFHKNWSGRLEYRYTDFGKLTGDSGCGGYNCYQTATASITDQSIRLVLTYRP